VSKNPPTDPTVPNAETRSHPEAANHAVQGRTLDEVIASMPAERQARIKARAAELQVEAEAYAAAEERGRVAAQTEPHAASVRYDQRRRVVEIGLTNGCTFTFPPRLVQGLETATDDDIAEVELLGVGSGLHWERLDVDVSVVGLLAGRFGSRSYMARMYRAQGEALDAMAALDQEMGLYDELIEGDVEIDDGPVAGST
jgi:hypothetical protein